MSTKSTWAQLRRFVIQALVIALSAFVLTSCPTPIGTVTNFPRTGLLGPLRSGQRRDGDPPPDRTRLLLLVLERAVHGAQEFASERRDVVRGLW